MTKHKIIENMENTLRGFLRDLQAVEKSMKIDIAIRNEKTKQFLVIAKSLTPVEGIYYLLTKENAIQKNISRYENYYWRPSQTETLDMLFVDDPQIPDTSKVYYEIQTSEKKKQYIFIMTEKVLEEFAKKYQKALIKKYQGDKGASFLYQFRRLPGFLNLKYEPPFLITYIKHGNLISKREIQIEEETQKSKPLVAPFLQPEQKKKSWIDFATTDDESRTDFSYALYLLRYHTENEVKEILRRESPNLYERKKNHVEDYLNRTVQNALKCFNLIEP